MGLRRDRRNASLRLATAVTGLVGAALLVTGCGESRHANEQRPSGSTRISVTINREEVIVQPTEVAMGAVRTQQIPQNQSHAQPPIRGKGPLDVTFVIANQTEADAHLQIRGAEQARSGTIYAHSPGSYGVELPAGSYVISAAGVPGAEPARLTVGTYRASSQNDVLLP